MSSEEPSNEEIVLGNARVPQESPLAPFEGRCLVLNGRSPQDSPVSYLESKQQIAMQVGADQKLKGNSQGPKAASEPTTDNETDTDSSDE